MERQVSREGYSVYDTTRVRERLRRKPEDIEAMAIDLSEGLEHHRRGHLDRASAVYQAALAEDPDRPDALRLLGLVALQRGKPAEALELLSRAVALRSEDASYHASLAEAYWALGELARAAECCRTALRLRPGDPEILCNLGSTLVDQSEIDAGIGHFREALAARPGFGVAHHNLANALRIKGEKAEALMHFRKAARAMPDNAEVRNALGQALLERGEPNEAFAEFREAVRLRPSFAQAVSNLGGTLRELGRLEEAQACYREANRLQPNLAAAWVGSGGILEELGESEHATTAYRNALLADPQQPGALARLATLLRDRLPENDRTKIENLLAQPGLAPERRWPLQFALAQVLDGLGDYQRAADLTLEANALRLADLKKQGRGYDPLAHAAFVDELISAFTPEYFERVHGFGLETERPVFVVGLPRSGTTLTEQILASHPQVFGAGELRLARDSFEALAGVSETRPPLRVLLDDLGPQTARSLARRHLDALEALSGSADRVVDKMPENLLYLGLIATLFPRARLIHCRRDLRDVALSCWMTNFTQLRWASNPLHIASRFAQAERLLAHWKRVLPIAILEVDYETMVDDLPSVARALVAWCGLDWNPACLEFHTTRRPVRTPSASQVRKPVYRSSIGRWKNYEPFLRPLFAPLGSGD